MMETKRFSLLILLLMVSYATSAQDPQYMNAVDAGYEKVFVRGNTAGWNLANIGYERDSQSLTSHFQLKYNDRISNSSYFAKADLYPKFSQSSFAHLAVGKSLSLNDIFPDLKLKGKYFHKMTSSIIAGAGVQYLSFSFDNIFIYDADLRWYTNNYLFLAESHLQIRNSKILGTAVLTGRRYLTKYTYIFAKAAYGQSPQDLRITPDFKNTLHSTLLLGGINYGISEHLEAKGALKYQKFKFSNTTSQNRFGPELNLKYKF